MKRRTILQLAASGATLAALPGLTKPVPMLKRHPRC
ncbi:hypothetical protein ABIE30_002481 [Janthinobacterium lividum]